MLATLLLSLLFAVPANSLIVQFVGLNLLSGNLLFIILLVLVFSMLSLFFGMLPVLKSVFSSFSFNAGEKTRLTVIIGGISNGLIVFQFAISIALIIVVLVISRQTDFAYKNGLGVQENNIICMESVHSGIQQKFEVFKKELLKYNSIQSVSAMMEPPGGEAND